MAVSFIPTSSFSLLRRPPSRLRSKSHARINASWQEVAGVMVFSAIPFTVVKAIANSPLGDALQRQMEQKKKLYADNSSKFKALSEKARMESKLGLGWKRDVSSLVCGAKHTGVFHFELERT